MVAEQDHHTVTGRKTPDLVVECVVYSVDRGYRAVCLDLGLIVERPSEDEALNELVALVKDHVQDGVRAGLTPQQILRPVPKSERRYLYRRLLAAAFRQWIREQMRWRSRSPQGPREGFSRHFCPV